MRVGHFESLKPVCPRCKTERQTIAHLTIASIAQQTEDTILQGTLICSNQQCQTEYPIIDAIPVIIHPVRQYVNDNFYHITVRDDLAEQNESLLGDIAGPGADYNSMRHYMSTYCYDHYGDQAPQNEFEALQNGAVPGSIVRCLNAGISMVDNTFKPPALDIGCAVGRSTFDVANHCNGLTLGIDLNFSLLKIAQKVLLEGRIRFPLKRTGIVYDRHEYDVEMPNSEDVDFWACDASALPFENEHFNFISALNVLDVVNSPMTFLKSVNDVLTTNGGLLLSTPYDWTPPVPMQNWLGGHAQRRPHKGSSETVLRNSLSMEQNSPLNLTITAEIEHHPWQLRVHNRHMATYDTHIIACKKLPG